MTTAHFSGSRKFGVVLRVSSKFGFGMPNHTLQPVRVGGNTAHTLHAVEHQSLGRQNRLRLALYDQRNVTVVDRSAVGQTYVELQ